MSYRVLKKTTKKTQYKCLTCKHCFVTENIYDERKKLIASMIDCQAENKPTPMIFNARDFYCVEYKMTSEQLEKARQEIELKDAKKSAREWKKKYHNPNDDEKGIQLSLL